MTFSRSKIRYAPLVVALALGLAVPALALARGGHGHNPHGMPGHGPQDPEARIEMMAAHLDLSDEQRAQLEEILDARREQGEARREQMKAAREALADQIHADVFDEIAIRAAAAGVAAIEADRAVARAEGFQQIKQILTPEQLRQLEEMREQRRGARRIKHGR